VGAAIDRLLQRAGGLCRSALVITHTPAVLDYLNAHVGHMMVDGQLVYSANPYHLFGHIKQQKYTIPAETKESRHDHAHQ